MHQCVSSPRQALSSRDRVVAASSSLKVYPGQATPKKRQHAPLGNSVIETQSACMAAQRRSRHVLAFPVVFVIAFVPVASSVQVAEALPALGKNVNSLIAMPSF